MFEKLSSRWIKCFFLIVVQVLLGAISLILAGSVSKEAFAVVNGAIEFERGECRRARNTGSSVTNMMHMMRPHRSPRLSTSTALLAASAV